MACEPQPCGHCKTVLIHDQCGKPEHMYCAVCHDGECNELTDMENDKLLETVKDLELQNEALWGASIDFVQAVESYRLTEGSGLIEAEKRWQSAKAKLMDCRPTHETKEPRKEDPPDPNGPAPELLPEDKAALDAIQCPVCTLPGLIRGTDTCRFAELHKV